MLYKRNQDRATSPIQELDQTKQVANLQINENKMQMEMRFLLQQLMNTTKKESTATMLDIYQEKSMESPA